MLQDKSLSLFILSLLLLLTPPLRAENWPQFRGPSALGYTSEKSLPIKWGGKDRENVLWSSPLPGEGHASPVIWGDRIFVCTVKWTENAADRKSIPDHHVTCYRTTDGKQLWDTQIKPGLWLRNDFRSGPGGGYAAPTPCTDGKHVFVAFGSAVLAALDLDGNLAWRKELVPYTFDVTLGSSPIVYNDTVILLFAMATKSDSRIAAFNTADGQMKWETKLPTIGFAHSTPLVIDVKGKPQMLVLASGMRVMPDGLQSFDPATGQRLWWCRGGGDASSPAYANGLVYFDSGRGGAGFAVDPTGTGDVSATHIKWTIDKLSEAIGSPIIVGDYLYRLQSPDTLKCYNATTGEPVYSNRLPGLTSTWASPLADAVGHLFFATSGKSVVVNAGPDFEILATNDLAESNHASPAVADGKMFLVGRKQIYCIGKASPASP
jgi:outer membrane protein assembly factor BamB